MGVTFSAVFESEVPPHGTLGGDTVQLSRAQKELDRLAKANVLRSIYDFESYDPEDVAASFDVETEEVKRE